LSGRVTRDVDVTALGSLLARPPTASVAYATDAGVELVPARAVVDGDVYSFGIAPDAAGDLDGREVVLTIEDGSYWFELRGVAVRGRARRAGSSAAGGLVWHEIEAGRVLAWDYGALRPL
jgi:hypothetical protein